jgi:hypothetical protein
MGFVLIPIATICRAYTQEASYAKDGSLRYKYHFRWKFMFLWDNYEDGICAGWQYYNTGNIGLQIIYWSCWRNPVNNLRITPILSCKIEPWRVGYEGNLKNLYQYDTKIPQWFFAWHGVYTNFYWQFMFKGKLRRFWIGWKIFPTDIYGVTEYRRHGAGFAVQLKTVA